MEVIVVPEEVLADVFEAKVDGLASRADEGRVVAVVEETVVDVRPWRVDNGFPAVTWLSACDPVEVPIARASLKAAVFGCVTSECVVGGEGLGDVTATAGRFVSLRRGEGVVDAEGEGAGCRAVESRA